MIMELEGKEEYWVEITNRFAASDNLNADVDINRPWETSRGNNNISANGGIGYYEFKKHRPCFEEGCSKLLDQRKQTKLQ
jgi:hypothetical protein